MSQPTNERADKYARTANLTESQRHRLLTSEQRRLLLNILQRKTIPVELDTLAKEIAIQEDGLDETDKDTMEQIKTMLHHNHLPMMDDLGVLDYDSDLTQIIE